MFSYQQPLILTKEQTMTRKDYVAIAGAISAVRQYSYLSGMPQFQAAIDQVTGAISQVLIEDNPRFDRQRFIAATMEGAK
jgi:carbamoylphosphate synthase large subunit